MSSKILLAAVLPAPESPVMIATCWLLEAWAAVSASAAGSALAIDAGATGSVALDTAPSATDAASSATSGPAASMSAIARPARGLGLDAPGLAPLHEEDRD